MFRNLKAEMSRLGLTNAELSKALGINIATVSAKLNSYDRLKYCEAKKIQQEFFPNCTVDYLFATDDKSA